MKLLKKLGFRVQRRKAKRMLVQGKKRLRRKKRRNNQSKTDPVNLDQLRIKKRKWTQIKAKREVAAVLPLFGLSFRRRLW